MLPHLARRLCLNLPAAACSTTLYPRVAGSSLLSLDFSSLIQGGQQAAPFSSQGDPLTAALPVATSSSPASSLQQAPRSPSTSTPVLPKSQGDADNGAAPSSSSRATHSSRKGEGGVSSGFRRIRSQLGQTQANIPGIVHITNSLNNVIVALTDLDGNLKTLVSAGHVGFKNARKSTPAAAERAADELAKRALNLGYGSVTVKLKGAGSNKQVAVQSLHAAGLRIKTLMDITGIPYNGCRAPKRRRV